MTREAYLTAKRLSHEVHMTGEAFIARSAYDRRSPLSHEVHMTGEARYRAKRK